MGGILRKSKRKRENQRNVDRSGRQEERRIERSQPPAGVRVYRASEKKMKETPEQIISKCVNNIVREIASWKYIQKYGCNDPFWPDGCNMNLTRNHIISYKHDIREICEANNMPLPEGYYLPTPPEVDNNYMASLKREDRVNRMRRQGVKFAKKKTEYDLEQLSLF